MQDKVTIRDIIIFFIVIVIIVACLKDVKNPVNFSKLERVNNEQETLNDILVCSHLFAIAGEEQHGMAMLVSMLTLVEKNKNLIIPKEKEAKEAVDKALNLARTLVRNPDATKKELALFSIGTSECIHHSITGALDIIGRRAKGER